MSSISSVANGVMTLATQVNRAASQGPKQIDGDHDHDGNKPQAVVEIAKYAGTLVKQLDMKV